MNSIIELGSKFMNSSKTPALVAVSVATVAAVGLCFYSINQEVKSVCVF
jgi:hypothetical protein